MQRTLTIFYEDKWSFFGFFGLVAGKKVFLREKAAQNLEKGQVVAAAGTKETGNKRCFYKNNSLAELKKLRGFK